MPIEPKPGRGRPPKPVEQRKRNTLAIRVRDDLKSALESTAEANQRSLSEEAEMRLEQSLAAQTAADSILDLAFGHMTAGLILLIARVMADTGTNAGFATSYTLEGASNWLEAPYAFNQATQAVNAVFEMLRPEGEMKFPPGGAALGLDMRKVWENLGVGVAQSALSALAGEPLGGDFAEWADRVGPRLGPSVINRIKESKRRAEAGAAAARDGKPRKPSTRLTRRRDKPNS